MINLISDTVTKPTPAMLEAMINAELGDDCFRSDPTVNALEAKVAGIFGKEAALFCPSGTMTNQIAIKLHTQPLDELICDQSSHVYQYETGGYAFNSGVAINLINGTNGKITPDQIRNAIKPNYDWLPCSRLLVIENSCNKGGGSYYNYEEMSAIATTCSKLNLNLHLDGARLFNVLVETQDDPLEIGKLFDTVSICLSKGLGAPVGSVLTGSTDDMRRARRYRKVLGGGMRQAGILAAAGIYALDHHIDRLKIDNDRARLIGQLLSATDQVKDVRPVETNIVIFELYKNQSAESCVQKFEANDILVTAFGPHEVRMVMHMDISEEQFKVLIKKLPGLLN